MNHRSPLHRFLKVSHDLGLGIAMRVMFSKFLGKLRPALALPASPTYGSRQRDVSIVLSSQEQNAAALSRLVNMVAEHHPLDWEVCIRECPSTNADLTTVLSKLRGGAPWLRTIMTDASVDEPTAARWTVEQATGRFVAILGPVYAVNRADIENLVDQLNENQQIDAVGSILNGLLLQRKSAYLAALPTCLPELPD